MLHALGVVAIVVFVGRFIFSVVSDMVNTPTWTDPKYRDKPNRHGDWYSHGDRNSYFD